MAEMEARRSEIMRKIWGADEEFSVMMITGLKMDTEVIGK